MQVHLRRRQAGSSSHGYTWAADGDIVPVEQGHADELLAIVDAGFTVVHPDDLDDDTSDDDDSFDEVDRADDATDRPVKRRPGRPRKTPLPN